MSKEKRFVVIRFADGWIVWDNLKYRVSDGIYYDKEGLKSCLAVAQWFNKEPQYGDRDWFREGRPWFKENVLGKI